MRNGNKSIVFSKCITVCRKVSTKVIDDNDPIPVVLARSAIFAAQEGATNETIEDNIDPAIKRLIKYANEDQDYIKIYDAIKKKMELKNLPKNHPAQKLKNQWQAMSIEESIPMLALYHG